MIKWQDCFYLVPGSELSERSVRSSGSDQSLSLSARSNTHSVSVLTELAWPSMLIIMSSTFPVTGTVMTCSDPGLSWVWPLTWSPGRLGSHTVHSPSSNPKGSLQKKPQKISPPEKAIFNQKSQMVFFLKASLTLANNFDSSWRWDHWWWYQRWCYTVLWAVTVTCHYHYLALKMLIDNLWMLFA